LIKLKRIYDTPTAEDDARFLVRDTEHNNAVALKEYLETKLSEEK
jgi:uncharacterized protein YeaO (DUF488 family)